MCILFIPLYEIIIYILISNFLFFRLHLRSKYRQIIIIFFFQILVLIILQIIFLIRFSILIKWLHIWILLIRCLFVRLFLYTLCSNLLCNTFQLFCQYFYLLFHQIKLFLLLHFNSLLRRRNNCKITVDIWISIRSFYVIIRRWD
jgi:hypothetical protein